jgi:hypothetical protein
MNQPLAYRNSRAHTVTDLDRFASQLRRAIPVLDLINPAGGPRFRARQAQVQAGGLTVSTEVHTPLHGSFGEDPHRAAIFFPLLGEAVFRADGVSLRARQGESVLFMPGCAYSARTTLLGGVVFCVDPVRLATLAAELAGDPSSSERYLSAFSHPQQWLFTEPLQRHLLRLMHQAIQLVDTVPDHQPRLPDYLRLDDLLFRIVTLLVHPQLMREDRPLGPLQRGEGAGES